MMLSIAYVDLGIAMEKEAQQRLKWHVLDNLWVYSWTHLSSTVVLTSLFFFHRNIVATVNLDCRLDLKTIALHARNAEYNPKVSILH